MGKYFLGIDNGGTVIKAGIFDCNGHETAVAGENAELLEPEPGWVERSMEKVWESNVRVIKKAIAASGINQSEIGGIGLTGYGNGICLVDGEGKPVCNAIVSSDSRAANLCEELRENGIEEQIYPLTYQEFWPAQTAVLLKWMKLNRPEVLKRTVSVLSIKDYIRMKLTGQRAYEVTETTCNGLMNIHTMEYDEAIFSALGIRECMGFMPEYTDVTGISGYVTEEAAEETGLAAGTLVAGSCYDVNACALASGIADDTELCMIAGTWSINEVLTKELIKGANSIARSYLPGYYIMEESSPTSANNFNWFIRRILKQGENTADKEQIYEYCNRAVESLALQDSEVVFVPYLYDSATYPDAKGTFLNLCGYQGREHLLRGIYEGISFSALYHVERLRSYGVAFQRAKLSGGITNSEVWSQMFSDVLGLPLAVSQALEPAALGAAMCAAVAAGVYPDIAAAQANMVHMGRTYEPNPERHNIYQKKFAIYKRALKALEYFHGESD